VGLGTWKSLPEKAGAAVEYALKECDYRHIDCAAIYRNEAEIGAAFERVFKSGAVKREEVFITSKLWNTEHARASVRAACEATLKDLKLDYLDLYLMHWGVAIPPNNAPSEAAEDRWTEQLDENGFLMTDPTPLRETWEAMEELVTAGLVKMIGVANFTAPLLLDLFSCAKVSPVVNQVELHPYLQQSALVEFCKYKGVQVTAYSPLGSPGNYLSKGKPSIAEDPVIKNIATKHGKTPAQVIIRGGVERGTVVIPKSVTPERIKENISIFDFSLDAEDMAAIVQLDRGLRFVEPLEWWKIPYFG
jgi:diketogulonate reductase-like aldo/keto reductase